MMKSCFYYFIQIALINSYIIYKNHSKSSDGLLSHEEFRMEVALGLIEYNCNSNQITKAAIKGEMNRRFTYCKQLNKDSKTYYKCSDCSEPIHRGCFINHKCCR
ncbi:unnamed protein product [Blepharisma stoltei]|uniref:Uncharacterized protein n=1 Tax=Blepharisma stoltei TaxID=1481888 RepID=A0AAU9JWR6_9CILI|nr:unnamed protein product [Blepharisma stoltei]